MGFVNNPTSFSCSSKITSWPTVVDWLDSIFSTLNFALFPMPCATWFSYLGELGSFLPNAHISTFCPPSYHWDPFLSFFVRSSMIHPVGSHFHQQLDPPGHRFSLVFHVSTFRKLTLRPPLDALFESYSWPPHHRCGGLTDKRWWTWTSVLRLVWLRFKSLLRIQALHLGLNELWP